MSTPERVWFRYRIAGPAQRSAAYVIDLVVQLAIVGAILTLSLLVGLLPGLTGVSMGGLLLGMFAVTWLYGIVFETALGGRTPGKLAMELRVVRVDGSPVRFWDVVLRNLVRSADFLPIAFGVGVVVMMFDPRFRRLGDLVGGTVVVAENKSAVLEAVRIAPPVTEAERQSLPARVELRPQEVEVIEAFLRRRRGLSDERRAELVQEFGEQLSRRTGVVAESWERVITLAYARATGKDRPT
ncbi:MAG: RDD family protein [Myxococcota bacterium]